MPTIVLNKITQPQPLSNFVENDSAAPLSFKEWIKNNIGIIPEDSQKQYERYISEFYTRKNQKKESPSNQLRNDYINLIKKLGSVFKNDLEFQRFSQIDTNSPTELKLAIPYFAKKLKEVALYYVKERENLKKTKLQYATIGSETGLERFLYNKLLNVFSQNIPLDPNDDFFINSENLNTIQNDFAITIEELYEDENYFENGIILDENPLFCVLDNEISFLCNSSDANEQFLADPLGREYLCEVDTTTQAELISEGWQKYSSSDLFYISGGERIPNIIDVNLSLNEDNNYFYWFSGETVDEIPYGLFLDTPLSSIDWSNATAGETIDSSDIIFATYGNLKTEAAWLMSADKISFVTEMTATMLNNKEFKFPYPDIGLSADSGEWTGRSLSDIVPEDKRFFPDEASYQENRKNVENLYWSDARSASSINDISIQDLNLWQQGAFASSNFKNADKLIVRTQTGPDRIHDMNPDEVFTGDLEIAWLYKFNQTQIPIIKEQSNIYFPLTSFNNSEELFLRYTSGDAIPLSSVKVNGAFSGAVAGTEVANSDFIIKKRSICGPELEAAWLEGTPLSAFRDDDPDFCICDDPNKFITSTDWIFNNGVSQPALSFKANANEIIKFVWTGPTTPISEIKGFNGFDHDDACPYKHSDTISELLETNFKNVDKQKAEKWKQCSCRAVNYSPIGQKNDNINAFNIIPDIILYDTNPNINNLAEWRGRDGRSFSTSSDASWFRLDENSIDNDVGWGKGYWKNDLVLEKGKVYWYYRTNLNRCDIDLPFFIINECYAETITRCDQRSNIPVWKKAVKNAEGEWVKTNEITDLVLSSGELYDYTHRKISPWSRSRIRIDGNYVTNEEFITVNRTLDKFSFDVRPQTPPSIDFLIKIPLTNARPYWGAGSYENVIESKNKNVLRGYNDNRLVGSYLVTNQAIPSEIILTDSTTIRYESSECSDCFIWKQPVTMNVLSPERRWNKVIVSDCVRSDILNYLHRNCIVDCNIGQTLCDCASECSSIKTGVVVTNEPSDMVFNTDLSGVPLFINYFARNAFDVNFQVEDIITPVYSPILSGQLVEVESPWKNLINDRYTTFVSEQSNENLKSKKELGLFVPSNVAIGKYELHDADSERRFNDNFVFRENNYFDGPYTPINIDSEWMKNSNGNPSSQTNQTYYPYQSKYNLGLYTEESAISPWELLNVDGCSVDELYSNYMVDISANILNWTTDIYGNQFFLTEDNSLWLKIGDSIISGQTILSSLFVKYTDDEPIISDNIQHMNIFYDTLELVYSDAELGRFITYNKLNWDYDTSTYLNYFDDVTVELGPLSSDGSFIASFLDDTIKKVHVFTLHDADTFFKINYHLYDINLHKIQSLDITNELNWMTSDLGVRDLNHVLLSSQYQNIIDIGVRTTKDGQHILNIFSVDIRNNKPTLIDVIKFQIDNDLEAIKLQRYYPQGLFLYLRDGTLMSMISVPT